MNRTIQQLLGAFAAALCFAYAGLAVAGPTFNYSFQIGPNTGFGSLETEDNGGGSFHAISGSLTVTGGVDIGTYSLGPGGPGFTLSPSGAVGFDNLLFPSSNPILDLAGLFFLGGGLEINIIGFDGEPNHYFFSSCNTAGCTSTPRVYNVNDDDPQGTFSVTAVPEPATLALLGLGLAGLGFSRRRTLN